MVPENSENLPRRHGLAEPQPKPTTEDTEETEATEQEQQQDRNHKGHEGTLRNGNCLKDSAHQNRTVTPMPPKEKICVKREEIYG